MVQRKEDDGLGEEDEDDDLLCIDKEVIDVERPYEDSKSVADKSKVGSLKGTTTRRPNESCQ